MDKLYETALSEEVQMTNGRSIVNLFRNILRSKTYSKLITQLACTIFGFLSSRATVFGGYSPFGIALTAAVPYKNMVSTSIGALIGCLFPSSVDNEVRYIASILAVVALKWALNDFKALKEHILFSPFIAAAPLFSTGVAISLMAGQSMGTELAISIVETIMAAAAAFFFSSAIVIAIYNRESETLNPQQIACISVCTCIILLGLSAVSISGVSIGRILAVMIILFCAQYGAVAGGAISGSAIGVILSFAGYNVSYLAGSYAFGGLISGVFSKFGRFATVIAFILSNAIVVLQSGDPQAAMSCLYEVAAATLIFMLIPKEYGDVIGRVFDPAVLKSDVDGLKGTVIMRLNFASDTLSDVSNCVEKIAGKLKKLYITDIDGVHKASADIVCKDCPQKLECWDLNLENTKDVMNNISLKLKDKSKVEKYDFPVHFASKCARLNDFVSQTNCNYRSYLSSAAAQNRVDDIRSVVKEQIAFMSDILTDFTSELNTYEYFDKTMSSEIDRILEEHEIYIKDVSCRINKDGIMSIEIRLPRKGHKKLLKRAILSDLEKVCGRKLDTPCVSTTECECRVQISEKPCFYVKSGAYQHICNNDRLCGDSYKYFNNGMGNILCVISDGMGTGGRAAVDSAMASGIFEKLIKAGIGTDCALSLVNSSLMVKSGEESIATMDVFSVNLFSGLAKFKKAGAAFTYIRHNGSIIKVDIPSLPAGILTKIKFGSEEIQLCDDDRIIMVSDGVTAGGDKWLMKEIAQWEDENEREFSERMVEQAQFRRSDGHDDDITVVAMRMMQLNN